MVRDWLGAPRCVLGTGLASEIGRAGLGFAVGDLGANAIVSFTERHNTRSRAVMERIGMHYAGATNTQSCRR